MFERLQKIVKHFVTISFPANVKNHVAVSAFLKLLIFAGKFCGRVFWAIVREKKRGVFLLAHATIACIKRDEQTDRKRFYVQNQQNQIAFFSSKFKMNEKKILS